MKKHDAMPADESLRPRPMVQDRTDCVCGRRIVACYKPNRDALGAYDPSDYYWRHERTGQLED